MEALCWLLIEADSPEMSLAQAYHSYRRARAAQLAEAGATDPADEPRQSASTMQALISFGQQFGYFFKAADHQQSQSDRAEQESLIPQPDRHSSDTHYAGPHTSPPGPPPGAFASSSHTYSDLPRSRFPGPSPTHTG